MPAYSTPQTWYARSSTLPHLGITGSRYYFIAATVACLCGGYWLVYRSRSVACAEGAACARPLPNRIVTMSLTLATVLVIGALALDFLAPLFL
jgi:mercuric ion transport protein